MSFRDGGETRIDRWVLVFVREPTLWPVLLVVVAHAVAFLGPLLLHVFRDGGAFAAAVLALLAGLSVAGLAWEWRRRGVGALTGLLAATWALSGAAALAADRFGYL